MANWDSVFLPRASALGWVLAPFQGCLIPHVVLTYLLDLQNDFYVAELSNEGCYDFASGILKLWWRKYYA